MFFLFQITNDPTVVVTTPLTLAMMGVGRALLPFILLREFICEITSKF